MRVMIWVDMEGISGITTWSQVTAGQPLYEEGRRLMTAEVAAAVRGARQAGAENIVVVDSHGAGGESSFRSLLPEGLEAGAEYVFGSTWTRYTDLLEEGCDAALFIGFHAMAGTPDGVLSHTVSPDWHQFLINDAPAGEVAICAAVCGHWGCPVVLVTGDAAACREAQQTLGEKVRAVAVKWGKGRFTARCLPPLEARRRIEEAVREALAAPRETWPAPYHPSQPTTLTILFTTPDKAEAYRGRVGVEVEGSVVRCRGRHFWEAWNHLWRP